MKINSVISSLTTSSLVLVSLNLAGCTDKVPEINPSPSPSSAATACTAILYVPAPIILKDSIAYNMSMRVKFYKDGQIVSEIAPTDISWNPTIEKNCMAVNNPSTEVTCRQWYSHLEGMEGGNGRIEVFNGTEMQAVDLSVTREPTCNRLIWEPKEFTFKFGGDLPPGPGPTGPVCTMMLKTPAIFIKDSKPDNMAMKVKLTQDGKVLLDSDVGGISWDPTVFKVCQATNESGPAPEGQSSKLGTVLTCYLYAEELTKLESSPAKIEAFNGTTTKTLDVKAGRGADPCGQNEIVLNPEATITFEAAVVSP